MPRSRKEAEEELVIVQSESGDMVEDEGQERVDRSTSVSESALPGSEDRSGSRGRAMESTSTKRSRGSKDAFLGQSVVTGVIILLFAGAAFFVYLGYRVIEEQRDERESIEVLSTRDSEPAPVQSMEPEPEPEAEPEAPAELDKSTVEIVVLNGGAPGGTAGKVTKILSDSGFTKAKADNAEDNHTGIKVYYGADSEAVAEVVKEVLSGTYSEIEIEPANPEERDTVFAPVTVIVAQ